jgi:hypothetical protein
MLLLLLVAGQFCLQQRETLIAVINRILQSEQFEEGKTAIEEGFC